MSNEPRIGRHHVADEGAAYHAYQSSMGEFAARVDRWKFAPYVHEDDIVVCHHDWGTPEQLARL